MQDIFMGHYKYPLSSTFVLLFSQELYFERIYLYCETSFNVVRFKFHIQSKVVAVSIVKLIVINFKVIANALVLYAD